MKRGANGSPHTPSPRPRRAVPELSPTHSSRLLQRRKGSKGVGKCRHYPLCIAPYFGAVIIGKLSVRKGDAGKPSLFHRFTSGKSAQPYRTATG